MIAQVYPLTRLPRACSFFDYKIGESNAEVGDLVEISFRRRKMYGIVGGIAESSEYKRLQTISEIIHKGLLTQADIQRFESMAKVLVLSPAQLLYNAYREGKAFKPGRKIEPLKNLESNSPPPSLSISKQESELFQSIDPTLSSQFIQLSKEGQYALASISAKKEGSTLIICPNKQECDELSALIPSSMVLHGGTGQKDAKNIIHTWSNQGGVLIGGKQASLLCGKNLKRVIVFSTNSDDYRFQMRNPRINAGLSAAALAKSAKASLFFTDTSLPFSAQEKVIPQPLPQTAIADLTDQSQNSHPLLSEIALKQAKSALQEGKSVLLFMNRKQSEENTESATNTLPKHLQEVLGEPVSVYHKDQKSLQSRIHLVTEAFFSDHSHIKRYNYGAVINVLADVSLSDDLRSSEVTYQNVCRLAFFARRQNASCLIQTFNPESLESMLDQPVYMAHQAGLRKRYNLPPYSVRILVSGPKATEIVKPILPETTPLIIVDSENCEFTCSAELWSILNSTFTSLPDSIILTVESPNY